MIARPDLGEYLARFNTLGDRPGREDVVDSPADVPLPHVAPRGPPREDVGILGIGRPHDIDEIGRKQRVEQLAFLEPLSDDPGLALLRVHVHVGVRDVDVAAHDELAALGIEAIRPGNETLEEAELGGVVLPAVRYIDRSYDEIAERHLHDPRLDVELRMAELG